MAAFAGLLFLLHATMLVVDGSDHVARDQRILRCFERGAHAVRQKLAAGQQLPAKVIDPQGIATLPEATFVCPAIDVRSATSDVPASFDRITIPPQGFLLSFTRRQGGEEWQELYASSSGRTTLLTSGQAYYAAVWPQIALFAILSLLAFSIAWRLTLRPLFKPRATA